MNNAILKNICIIWQGVYPWDVRIEKFTNTLTRTYKVILISKGKSNKQLFEKKDNFESYRVIYRGILRKLFNFPFIFNPVWFLRSLSVAKENDISLIIIRDLPLMWLGILLKVILKTPLIFDMAENYPAALIAYEKKYYKPFLIGNAFFPRIYERIALKMSNHIIVVTEEQKERLMKLGTQPKKISVISNTPVLGELNFSKEQGDSLEDKIILYTGKIDAHRGVESVIKAMPKVLNIIPAVKLILAGDGTETEKLSNLAMRLGVIDKVKFLGQVSHQEIYENIQKSSVCLIPHLKSEHTDTTLPNKLFDYMALGKPVIASDLVPVVRIIHDYECGIIFKSNNHNDLADQIIRIFLDKNTTTFGKNGQKAVKEKFNWEVDSVILERIISELF